MLRKSLFNERVKLARSRVGLNLAIPPAVIVLDDPVAQFCEGVVVQTLYLSLDGFEIRHQP
jgi:hypothetical protein